MKNQKGITLIALVITIIVLLILAAVSISAIVSEDGITNRAQDAKDKTAIATEKEQINLAYSACKAENIDTKEDGIKAPVEVSQMQAEMDRAYGAGAVTVSGSGSGLMVQYANSKRTYMIMQNGKTIVDVSVAFKGNANGPIGIAEDGSMVDLTNWMYQYYDSWYNESDGGYFLSSEGTAFGTGYVGDIVSGKIVGKVPAFILENPEGTSDEPYKNELIPVISMDGTFEGITELEYPPEIPNSVISMTYTFGGCTNLKKAPVIPKGVIDIHGIVAGCELLKEAPVIPDSVECMYYAFDGCSSLEKAPAIPNKVKDMSGSFYGCTNLRNAPSIPSSVEEMSNTFKDCINLTGRLEINANINFNVKNPEYNYGDCFENAATEPGCSLVIVGSGINDESIDVLFGTKSDNSQITIGN